MGMLPQHKARLAHAIVGDIVPQAPLLPLDPFHPLSLMNTNSLRSFLVSSFLILLAFGSCCSEAFSGESLELRRGDHVCLVGNALGERLQHNNHWEAQLHKSFPDLDLTVRNLCIPGDEPHHRIRSENFGTPDDHLRHSQASVILYFFGYNESFAGLDGIAAFKKELVEVVQHTLDQDYGSGTPRVMLISPIAFEQTGDRHLPRAEDRNPNIIRYRDAMKAVAQQTGVAFADLFDCSQQLYDNSQERLTSNGCHLNDRGYQAIAAPMLQALFGILPMEQPAKELVAAVDDKNFHWWHRYRAVNGFSIYGKRGQAGQDGTGKLNNQDVMERERAILDQMTVNRDKKIWAIAKGKPESSTIDDSNTLPFLEPTTNVGLPDDPNAKRGKLGSLEYLSATEQVKLFDLHPDFEIQLVASEEQFPELANPVALNFDAQGRLHVSVMPSYPHWKPKTKQNDKILCLQDTNQDGLTDRVVTCVEGLHQPMGFEFMGNGIVIVGQQDILYAEDTDGDGRAESVQRLLVGFDTADSHHGIAAMEWGPGGNLYFQEGTFKFSQVETPSGLVRLGEGGVWQYHPKTQDLSVFVNFAFSNPWGHCFDRWGQSFIGDASPGYAYWSAAISGRLDFPLKHPGGSQHRRIAQWTGGDPNYQFPTFYPKRTRPLSGCAIISSDHFPESMQGNFLVTNVIGDRGVLNHEVREDGSGFVGKEVQPLLMCRDGNFRPVDIQIAPDGSLYIVDWHNALIGHLQHNLRDPSRDHSHGRIWRLKHKTRPLSKIVNVEDLSIPELLDHLHSREDRVRYRTKRELARRDSGQVQSALTIWLAALDPTAPDHQHHLSEALWMHQVLHEVNENLLERMLKSSDHRARSAAVNVLAAWINELPQPLALLKQSVRDEHPRVRLASVRALSLYSGIDRDETEVVKTALAVLENEIDERIQYALDETMRRFAQVLGRSPQLQLDLPEPAIEYQLASLSIEELNAIPTDRSVKKHAAVFAELLLRPETIPSARQDAVEVIAALREQTSSEVLLQSIENAAYRNEKSPVMRTLADDLVSMAPEELAEQKDALINQAESSDAWVRSTALAGLIAAGATQKAFDLSVESDQALIDLMETTSLLPANLRRTLAGRIQKVIASGRSAKVKQAAIEAIGRLQLAPDELFRQLAPLASDGSLRNAVVQTLSRLPSTAYSIDTTTPLLETLLDQNSKVPLRKRTNQSFQESLAFCRKLVAVLPDAEAAKQQEAIDRLVVQLVRIGTIEEEMRYDIEYFAVEVGKPVQILLENHDLMPHNLVLCEPGTLKQVANAGLQAGPKGGSKGLPYVPDSQDVLHATGLVDSRAKARLTFHAPTEPGEYPYVCTFPQHWYRMYGVMVVVENLEEWQENPTKPANPIGSTRSFVANWEVGNFTGKLEEDLATGNKEKGKQIFAEASCLGCHSMKGQGGNVGPELTDVFAKFKGDAAKVLRSILEPSEEVDEKYVMQKILTLDGQTFAGILVSEDEESVKLLTGANSETPLVILQDEIQLMQASKISMMPKALLDQYTIEEIMDLMAYLKNGEN